MKKLNVLKRVGALFMATALCISGINYQTKEVKAADVTTICQETLSVAANTPVTVNFTITNEAAETHFVNYFPEVTAYNLEIKNETETICDEMIYSSDDYWYYDGELVSNGYYFSNLPAGNYTMTITTYVDTASFFHVYQTPISAKLNYETMVVTKGFSNTLKAENGTVKSWKSSNKKVATVSSKGKVTGKKKGSATITATLEDGSTLKCKVTVKENVYSRTKNTISDYNYGEAGMHIYKMAYNKKGDLVLTGNFVNYCGHTVTKLNSYKYTIKTVTGKVIGKLSIKNKKVNIPNVYAKKFTFTIKKKDLKLKKTQDIRIAEIVADKNNTYSFTS